MKGFQKRVSKSWLVYRQLVIHLQKSYKKQRPESIAFTPKKRNKHSLWIMSSLSVTLKSQIQFRVPFGSGSQKTKKLQNVFCAIPSFPAKTSGVRESRGRHGDRSDRVGFGRYLVGSRSRSSRGLKLEVASPCFQEMRLPGKQILTWEI